MTETMTPESYLADLEEGWRRDALLALRTLLLEAGLEEGTGHGMLAFRRGEDTLFHLKAQKGYVSLYAKYVREVDPEGELLEGLDVGRACIRFKKKTPPAETRVAELIDRGVAYDATKH